MLPKKLPFMFSISKKTFISSTLLWSIKNQFSFNFINYLELKTVGKEGLTLSGNGVSTSFQPANCPCWQLAKPFVSHHTITLTSHHHSHSICSAAYHSHLIAAFLEFALNLHWVLALLRTNLNHCHSKLNSNHSHLIAAYLKFALTL